MSHWDVRGLETNFEGFRKERFPTLSITEAFERFAAYQLLKDADLSSDELESGILGGPGDGGVDAMYFLVNRILVQDETDLPDTALTAELIIMQAKYDNGFAESVILKLKSFARDLLDYNRPVDQMVHLGSDARDAILRFRDNYSLILGSSHTMSVTFVYASKSDKPPNPQVLKRVESLKQFVSEQLSDSSVAVDFWGCQRLLAEARRTPRTQQSLEISKQFTADDGSAVCLAKLESLAALLRDEHGDIRRSMLEPNVLDYQGKKNAVNARIRHTLEEGASHEFWWLNNGITILAEKCSVVGNKLVVVRPEVVNGLQTSYEIFHYFRSNTGKADTRNVLIRVIVPPDENVRSKIIRATNSQTPISDLSLHATDPIHFDIEEKLRLYQLYYERRKGEYRELKKPVDQIISIQTLARAVIAILLQQPHNAYATPSRVLKNKENYDRIFDESHNRDMYVTCMLIQRQADAYLLSRSDLKEHRSILRYYLAMAVSCALLETGVPSSKDLAGYVASVTSPINSSVMSACCEIVMEEYKKLGGTETVAKGPEMLIAVRSVFLNSHGPAV